MNKSVIHIVLVLLWMVCITTQTAGQQAACDKLVKKYDRLVKKNSCQIPVDGVWEEWTETSTCTVTCGGGKKTYSRKCIKPQHGRNWCEGDAGKIESCGEQECPVDGVWEEWTETSTCTVTCGGGNKIYSRKCIKPQHGGNWCEGDAGKIESCGEQECPFDGVWEEWTETSTCTVTCGGGKKIYSRKCIKPQHGGNWCEGDAGKIESCGEQECPVNGVWEEWTEASTCTVTCGGGNKTYSRKCIKPQHGGNLCEGDAGKIESCGEQECPDPWWQCDPVRVYKGVKIPWNPECQTITVSTDSEAGSGETVRVYFYDTDGAAAGGLSILVSTEIHFRIGFCSTAFTPFSTALLPTETEKTWTITYNYRYKRVVFHCNGVQVLNVLLSSECDNIYYGETWTDYWGSKPTQIQFHSSDSASDTYCFSSNPGNI